MPQGTVFYHFYRLVAALFAPLVWVRVSRKLARQGVTEPRRRERLGHATLPRPEGRLIWFHAASVGESLSVLALARRMMERQPATQVLITSGTASSAEILDRRMPKGCRHQFAPLDRRDALKRFLAHWRPDAVIFVESELWPQMLVMAHRTGAPLALVNARMSAASMKNWTRFDTTARFLLGLFCMIRTQDKQTLDGLLALGADPEVAQLGPNLKSLSDPLPVDDQALAQIQPAFSGPVWVAASTHPGEEEKVLAAQQMIRKTLSDAKLILVPRHPDRAEDIAAMLARKGVSAARRSLEQDAARADVYLADSYGEMGLWYRLAPVVFLGGSLGRAGGHNPYEPAHMGCALVSGKRVANFGDVYAAFDQAGAVTLVKGAKDLGKTVTALLSDPALQAKQSGAALALARSQMAELDGLAASLDAQLAR